MIGDVYFIAAPSENLVKIGYASNVSMRFSSLKTGSPVPLHLVAFGEGTIADEQALHGQFASLRSHLEWFRYEAGLAALLFQIWEQCSDANLPDAMKTPTLAHICATMPTVAMDRWDFEDHCFAASVDLDRLVMP